MRAALPTPTRQSPQTMMTSLGGQPIAPTPLQAPHLPTSPQAPTALMPTSPFVAPTGPNPYQFRIDQANRGAERSAAAHGTLLSGGFQAALARLNQNLASEETQNVYDRARDTYALNLSADTAGYDRAYGAARDTFGDQRDAALQQSGVDNANAQSSDIARQQMSDYTAQLEAQKAAAVANQNAQTTAMQGTMPGAPMAGKMPTRLGLPGDIRPMRSR